MVRLDADMARADAEHADRMPRNQRGPFHGVPFLVKDLGSSAKGLIMAAGSAAIERRASPPATDSNLVAAFRSSGLVPFGVSANPPFGLSLTCEPEGRPPTRNPWNTELTAGGSSGGAAAAVAAGIIAMAHATDAAGSIRVPAACCGLTGLKPTRGAIPAGPDYSNHLMGIATEMVLARSLRDVRTAARAICIPKPPTTFPKRPTIGLALPDRCGDAQKSATRNAAEALRDAGCSIREIDAPDSMGAVAQNLARTILAVSLADWLTAMDITDDEVPATAAALAQEGRDCPATRLFAVSRDMASLSARANTLFADLDAILMPTLSQRPLPVGANDLLGSDLDAHFATMEAFAPNAALANVAGLPALALPCGISEGLPLGVQLMGAPGADMHLLELGAMIESRVPPLDFPSPIAGLAP